MSRDELMTRLRLAEPAIRAHGAAALYVYGSHARDEAGPASDVDVFVDVEPGREFDFDAFMAIYAGGKPFKDLGARFIAHKNARAQLQKLPHPDVLMPDEVVDRKRAISLGGTTLELIYVGRNHSDNSLVMRLPKEKLIFTVDFVPIQSLPFRNLPDTASPPEWEESLKRVLALDWERMIPGHPYAGGRLGTKQDVRDLIGYMQDLGADVKKAAAEGKCTDTAMKEVKLPKYEKWGNYAAFLPMNVERYCYLNNGF